MKNQSKEFLVGCLVLLVVVLVVAFGYLMGVVSPFSRAAKFSVLYSFAGGVEVGSPVRVAGVKVGRVEQIEFLAASNPPTQEPGAVQTPIRVVVSVSEAALPAVKSDSKFFVNMAGIIGERYIEISPGSVQASALAAGATVRGEDPPRIDQLLSQGYGVFGRVHDFLEANEKTIAEFLQQTSRLMTDANKVLKSSDRAKLAGLLTNLSDLSGDLAALTREMREPQAKAFFKRLEVLVERAHEIDQATLKKFLQEEGIRARIF